MVAFFLVFTSILRQKCTKLFLSRMATTANCLPTSICSFLLLVIKSPHRNLDTNIVSLRATYGHVISFPLEYEQKRHVPHICITFLKENICPPLSLFSLRGARCHMWWEPGLSVWIRTTPSGADDVMGESRRPSSHPPLASGLSRQNNKLCLAGATAALDPLLQQLSLNLNYHIRAHLEVT